MILVDTTVWVDFFRDHKTPQVQHLTKILKEEGDVCLCGFILTEVLQGIRNDNQFAKTKKYFTALINLPISDDVFLLAAEMYRKSQSYGLTIRKTIDCLIAACAILHDVALLHNDQDYENLAKYTKLKCVKVKQIKKH